jgi:hypothetical protein
LAEESLCPGQRQEAAQAAHVGRGEPVPRVPLAELVRQQVQCQVVAADGHYGACERLRRPEQVHRHGRARLEALLAARDAHDAVGAHQRHQYT